MSALCRGFIKCRYNTLSLDEFLGLKSPCRGPPFSLRHSASVQDSWMAFPVVGSWWARSDIYRCCFHWRGIWVLSSITSSSYHRWCGNSEYSTTSMGSNSNYYAGCFTTCINSDTFASHREPFHIKTVADPHPNVFIAVPSNASMVVTKWGYWSRAAVSSYPKGEGDPTPNGLAV